MLKERGLVFRLWIAASLLWVLFFGYRSLVTWRNWAEADNLAQSAFMQDFANRVAEFEGMSRYFDSREESAAKASRTSELRANAEEAFYTSLGFLIFGPFVLAILGELSLWVINGNSNTRKSN